MKPAEPLVILLVEDSPTARFHAQACLHNAMRCEYSLLQADSLQAALKLLAENEVAVILLDLNLPDSQGLDTFWRVQRVGRDAAIVIISGDADERTARRAVRSGAQDYIVKGPSFTAELLARTVHFALERTSRAIIENELASIRHDLQIAEAIQQRLYPRQDSQFPHVSVAGRCMAATQNCGDYYDFIIRPDGSLLIVIGDVSGHGIGPAMMMVETRAFLRALAVSAMTPGEMLTHVNRLLAEDMQQRLFVTLFVASLDASGRQLSFSSAGHPGYLIKGSGQVLTLQSDHPPLGIVPAETFSTELVPAFQRGDLLALFTDGISEATCDHEAFLGDQRVLQEIVLGRERAATMILESLFALAANFNGDVLQQDDRTAVIVKTFADALPPSHRGFPATPETQGLGK